VRVNRVKRAFLYMDDVPRATGSGAQLRFYSNVCAYVDNGFEVEVVRVGPQNTVDNQGRTDQGYKLAQISADQPSASAVGRLWYRLGYPTESATKYYFAKHEAVRRAVLERARNVPGAVHQLEGESMANIIPFVRLPRFIWSLHDLPSAASAGSMRIACETDNREPSAAELRDVRFARRLERRMAAASPLILGISKYDCDFIRSEWHLSNIEHLPMSISAENRFAERNMWMPQGKLRLLHLGRISHLPTFRSLEFLLTEVLPILDKNTLQRIDLNVVGTVDPGHPGARRILSLSEKFPQIRFSGFVEHLDPVFQSSDLQLVAATEATGLRTRIIESFAAYLPVLTTSVGVRGIEPVETGKNLWIADAPAAFAAAIAELAGSPELLATVSREARATYDQFYSRRVVASTLNRFLKKHFDLE
jgi:glycosyltransferase involved in cell wall biosynthesis